MTIWHYVDYPESTIVLQVKVAPLMDFRLSLVIVSSPIKRPRRGLITPQVVHAERSSSISFAQV